MHNTVYALLVLGSPLLHPHVFSGPC